MDDFEDLLRAALESRERAYAPYSQFKVGAAVRTPSGAVYAGCNVENASYPVGSCAEANAIAAMIAGGEYRIRDLLVASPFGRPAIAPCGACRQRILEFADSATRVALASETGVARVYGLDELLPHAFRLEPRASEADRNSPKQNSP